MFKTSQIREGIEVGKEIKKNGKAFSLSERGPYQAPLTDSNDKLTEKSQVTSQGG